MKKFISVLVVCSMLCALTACGQKLADDTKMQNPPEYQQKIAVSDIDIQYSTEPQPEATTETTVRTGYTVELPQETTKPYVEIQYSTESQPKITESYVEIQYSTEYQPETTETYTEPKQPENVRFSADIYSAIENYLECINNNDIYGIIKASYPDRYADTIKNMTDNSYIELEDIIGDTYKEKNMHLSGANSYETMSSDYISRFSRLLGAFEPWRDYVEKTGTDKIDYNEFVRVFKKAYNDEYHEYFKITKAVKINCNISSDSKGIHEHDMILYYVDGEGWKVDIVFMPCIQNIDEIKNNEFINSLYTLTEDIADFVEENIVDKIIDYGKYYDDYDYYDDFDYFDDFGDMLEDEVNGFLSDINIY